MTASLSVNRTSELTYTPAWWVPGTHLQTMWGNIARRLPAVVTRGERWRLPDDDEIELRRLDSPLGSKPQVPRLLLLHGLEGSIRSHYLLGTLSQAQTRGWSADVLIFRGCNGEGNRARRMYHSGETTDLDFVVRRLVRENPKQPLIVAGFSLGGNVLLKWLGEQGVDVPTQVRAAAAVSVPYDLERGGRHIEHGFSRLYTYLFLRSLRSKAATKLNGHPDLFDSEAMMGARTLYAFDDAVTAPVHGFADAHEYYEQSSSLQFLSRIRRPTLLLSASDDPFMPPGVLDSVAEVAQESGYLLAEFWPNGGHVGFVSGWSPLDTHYYAEERVVEFLARQMEEDAPFAF